MTQLKAGYRLGPYVISQALPGGKGGMAYTYIAQRHLESGGVQEVVLKIMKTVTRDQQTQDFFSEAINNEVETLKRLHHPHIVHLYPIAWGSRHNPYIARVTTIPGQPWFYVMEYLKGGSIKYHLRERGHLSIPVAVEIAYQISQALDYMHSEGVAHLDIKPENILLRYPLRKEYPLEAVVIDFGIARRQQAQTLAGSLPFMPPERVKILKGLAPPERMGENEPADIYSLGITLFQMLTGKLPFSGRTNSSITTAILNRAPTAPSIYNHDVPKALDNVIWRMLAKNPKERPGASELPLMLDEAVAPPRFIFSAASSPGTGRGEGEAHRGANLEKVGLSGDKWKTIAGAILLLAALEPVLFLTTIGGQVKNILPGNRKGMIAATAIVASPTPAPVLTRTTALPANAEAEKKDRGAKAPTATLVPSSTPLALEATSTPMPTFTPRPTSTKAPTPTATPGS